MISKLAVEYIKETTCIEDALHNVITYMDDQQAKSSEFYLQRTSISISDNDNNGNSSNEEGHGGVTINCRPYFPVNRRKNKQMIRKLRTQCF